MDIQCVCTIGLLSFEPTKLYDLNIALATDFPFMFQHVSNEGHYLKCNVNILYDSN